MKYFAAIGTDGTNHVVWGLGNTAKQAIQNGTEEMKDCRDPLEDLTAVEITQKQDQKVRDGEVSCKALGIKVY